MAWLRALIHKMATSTQAAWVHARHLITGAAHLGRTAAATALAIVGTPGAYDATTHAIRKTITTVWRLGTRILDWMGQRTTAVAHRTGTAIGALSPTLGRHLARLATAIATPLRRVGATVRGWIETAAQLTWMLASSDLVRVSTTRSAQLALGLIGVHALTQGAAAARLIDALPWTVTLVSTATDPVRALLFVAGTAAAAMAIALAQLLRQLRTQPEDPSPVAPAAELGIPHAVPDLEAEVLTDLAVIAGKVAVEVQRDGSVVVTGIPDTVPEDLGHVVAEIALDAAMRRIRRTLPVRPVPSRDDRRLFTKAARDAVRAEAERRRGQVA
jgi:hypothetical protein